MLIYTGYERKPFRAPKRSLKKTEITDREREKEEAFHAHINANISHLSA